MTYTLLAVIPNTRGSEPHNQHSQPRSRHDLTLGEKGRFYNDLKLMINLQMHSGWITFLLPGSCLTEVTVASDWYSWDPSALWEGGEAVSFVCLGDGHFY